LFLGSAAFAQEDPAVALRNASDRIERATAVLAAAAESDNQVLAMSDAIRSLEDGLAALRLALMESKTIELQKETEYAANRREFGNLLAVLERIGSNSTAQAALHPGGATDAMRAGMILSQLTPDLLAKSEALRQSLAALSELNRVHEAALGNVRQSLTALQEARNRLAVAVREEADISGNNFASTVDISNLVNTSRSLGDLSARLSRIQAAEGQVVIRRSSRGIPYPVSGLTIRRFNEPNAAGIRQPGILIAAGPLSLVQAPQAGTVRFAGDFMEYGNVVIIEPSPQNLQIYAGFGQIFVKTGDVLESGAAMGLLGGETPDSVEFLAENGGQNDKTNQRLYVEIRENGIPVDPELVFAR
jgi:septal ring factor EnvC (AmiA/AmiB activator)